MTTEIAHREQTRSIISMTHNCAASLEPQQRLRHRASIAIEIEALLDGYWQNRPSEPVKERILAAWMDELERFGLDEIVAACRRWTRDNPRRKPNYGDITGLLRDARAEACRPHIVAMTGICHGIADKYAIPEWMLRGSARDARACDARAEAITQSREQGIPLAVIGEFFGGRDHTTVMAAIERHKRNTEAMQ